MNINEFKKCINNIYKLALPILAGNLGQMLINLGDIFVAGHYNTNVLAAISVASALFMTFIVAGFGLVGGITPVLSNYRGEKIATKQYFVPTVIYSLIIGLLFFLLVWALIPLVNLLHINKLILDDCITYLKISSFSVFGLFLFGALKEYLQAHEIVKLPNTIIIVSVFANLILNFIFVYGIGFIPEMGTSGLAVASLIVRTTIALILFIYCLKFSFKKSNPNIFSYTKDLIKVGLPISFAMFVEFLGFNIVAVLVGSFEPVYAACHNIIITVTSVVYMIPYSIASALAVKIGYANGKNNLDEIKNYLKSALVIIGCFSGIIITAFLLLKKEIIEIFTSDINVINIGASIMVVVACFNIFDAIQSIFIGALKGMKHTLSVLIIDFMGYILIAIPVGLFLAYKFNMNLYGFWVGLAFGILSAALISVTLFIRVYQKRKYILNA